MAVATRFVLRNLLPSLAAFAVLPGVLNSQEAHPRANTDYSGAVLPKGEAVGGILHAQDADEPPVIDDPGVLTRSKNKFAFQFIPDLYAVPPGMSLSKLLPPIPKSARPVRGPMLTNDLAQVPEAMLGEPVDSTDPIKARKELVKQVTHIRHLNENHDDAFIKALVAHRPDLAGLPFLLGDACRLDEERVPYFQSALELIRQHVVFANMGSGRPEDLLGAYRFACAIEDPKLTTSEKLRHVIPARVALLMQIEAPESAEDHLALALHLGDIAHTDSTRALARLTLFSPDRDVRQAAIEGLKSRREKDYTDMLLQGLRYPWPEVANRATEVLVRLERHDVLPSLVDLLEMPDPREPVVQKVKGKEVPVVRELVKINHMRNCALCHAPASLFDRTVQQELATASIPIPGERQSGYGSGFQITEDRVSEMERERLKVRIDVTYLRQDFSVMLNEPGQGDQRFDFLVRTRVVSEKEAEIFRDKLAKRGPGAVTPYERAILYALRELTGRDTEPTAAAWRKLLASR
jgi:hypothetical protein